MKYKHFSNQSPGGNHDVTKARVQVGRTIGDLSPDLEVSFQFETSQQRVARAKALLDLVSETEKYNPAALSPQNLAQFFFGIGKLARADAEVETLVTESPSQDILKRAMRVASRQSDSFKPCDIAQTLRGLSFLNCGDSLAGTLLARGVGLIQSVDHSELLADTARAQFRSQDITMILGALRKMPESSARDVATFIDESVAFIERHIESFAMLDRARCARYLRGVERYDAALWIIREASADFASTPSKCLGMFISALRDLGPESKNTALHLIDEIEARLADNSRADLPIQLGDAVRALGLLAHLKIHHERYIKTFCARAQTQLGGFSADELRETIHSLGTLRRGSESFLQVLGNHISARLEEFSPLEIVSICWGFAATGMRHDKIRAAAAKELDGQLVNLRSDSVAALAWSYALVDDDLSRVVIAECAEAAKDRIFDPHDRRTLHIAEIAVGLKAPGQCDPEIIKHASEEAAAIGMNEFEHEVYDALKALTVPELQIRPFESVEGLTPDFVLTLGDKHFILECDGVKYHLTPEGRSRGSDVIHDRIFKRAGFEVIHILDREWEGRSQFEQVTLLRMRLGI
jgi:hypothetical protein